jgi:uncharacterized membrane protein YccF (DUF307 family)
MRFIGNLIWFLFGGCLMGLGWWLVGLIMLVTIVGIPWSRSAFVIGSFCFFPFGKEVIGREDLSGESDIGTGVLGFMGNVIWFLVAGIWLAIGHVGSAFFCFITIIGIPFGIQHLKLAMISLAPIGQTVIESEELRERIR